MRYAINFIDQETQEQRDLWIEDGKVRYASIQSERAVNYQLATNHFDVYPGRVTLDEQVAKAFQQGEGISYVKHLLLYGFTSFIHLINMEYHHDFTKVMKVQREALTSCPIDYIHAVKIPLARLTDVWIRKLKQESVFIVFITSDSIDEIESIPWQRIVGAMFPKRVLIIFQPSSNITSEWDRRQLQNVWKKKVKEFGINTFYEFPAPGQPVSTLLAQRIGLFPQKGSLITGSDADYLMYGNYPREEQPLRLPDIIVLKGKVVKGGNHWDMDELIGEEITSLMPEKFLPIEFVNKYEDE